MMRTERKVINRHDWSPKWWREPQERSSIGVIGALSGDGKQRKVNDNRVCNNECK